MVIALIVVCRIGIVHQKKSRRKCFTMRQNTKVIVFYFIQFGSLFLCVLFGYLLKCNVQKKKIKSSIKVLSYKT